MKLSALLLGLVATSALWAVDVAYSPPVGGMTVSITGGTALVPGTTWFSIPLYDRPAAQGIGRGKLTSLTANTITVTGAGWTAGALSTTAYPYSVRFLTGSGDGVVMGVIANTTDTLTLSGSDLTQLGVVTGDAFQLVPVDTLDSLFGATTFLGGTTAATADTIILASSTPLSFYYNTNVNHWVRATGPTSDKGFTPIQHNSVIGVVRRSTAFSLVFLGDVPTTKARFSVAKAGSTYTHTGFPTDIALGDLSLTTMLPGWVSALNAADADLLLVNTNGSWLQYFHNGSYWRRTTISSDKSSVIIPAGAAVQFFKRGTATGNAEFTRQRPYSL